MHLHLYKKQHCLFSVSALSLAAVCVLMMPGKITAAEKQDQPLRIAVASDLHYLTRSLTDNGAFFQQLVDSADGKVMLYSEELMEAFTEQMIDEKPDILILSGDLTFNGEKDSHYVLAEKLARISEAGVTVLALPGNHDMDSGSAASFHGDSYTLVDSVTPEEFQQLYAPYGYEDALASDASSCSYIYEVAPDLRVLMIDVNGNDRPGYLTEGTLSWAEGQLLEAEKAGASVIAVSHQNLLSHNSIFIDGYQIGYAGQLQSLYEQYNVLCNLSGHMHIQHISETDAGLPEILTSALSVTPLHYGMLEVQNGAFSYTAREVDVSAWAKAEGSADDNLLHFDEYAYQYFWNNTYRQTYPASEGQERQEELAVFMADLNTAYFSGNTDTIKWDTDLAELWKGCDPMWAIYLLSIEQEGLHQYCVYDSYSKS